ncbi:hypothetical protein Tco_0524036 [Tanacetum coccineum]
MQGNGNRKKQLVSGNNDMMNMNDHSKSSSSKVMGRGNRKGKEKVEFRRKQNRCLLEIRDKMAKKMQFEVENGERDKAVEYQRTFHNLSSCVTDVLKQLSISLQWDNSNILEF